MQQWNAQNLIDYVSIRKSSEAAKFISVNSCKDRFSLWESITVKMVSFCKEADKTELELRVHDLWIMNQILDPMNQK